MLVLGFAGAGAGLLGYWTSMEFLHRPATVQEVTISGKSPAAIFGTATDTHTKQLFVPPAPISPKESKQGTLYENQASSIGFVPAPNGLDTVQERQQYFDQLITQPANALWDHWFQLFHDEEKSRLEIVSYALASSLRQPGTQAIYRSIAGLLEDPSLSAKQKTPIVHLLAETATSEALRVVLERFMNGQETTRSLLLDSIVKMTRNRWGGRFHPELSPLLEEAWVQYQNDQEILWTVAHGIAKVGSVGGVKLLLTTVANSAQTMEEIEKQKDSAGFIALQSMKAIRNSESTPILAQGLNLADIDNPMFIASGEALVALGKPEATKALFEWAK